MHGRKEFHTGLCLEQLGHPNEAKEHYWTSLISLHSDEASECARRLLQLHQARGTIDELRKKISALSSEAKESKNYEWLISQLR